MSSPLHVKIVRVEDDVASVHPQVREDMVRLLHRINYLFEGEVEFSKKVMLRACQCYAKKYGTLPSEWMDAVQKIIGY